MGCVNAWKTKDDQTRIIKQEVGNIIDTFMMPNYHRSSLLPEIFLIDRFELKEIITLMYLNYSSPFYLLV